MTTSAILPDGIHLVQNGVYRGRLSVSFLGTQSAVSDGLGKQGFTEVIFFDKGALPTDWPADQRADEAKWPNWTGYLQGRFTMTDRVIPLSELPAGITLNGMWLYDAAATAQPKPPLPGPQPQPDPRLPPADPVVVYGALFPSAVGPVVASAAGVALGFAAAKFLARKKGKP